MNDIEFNLTKNMCSILIKILNIKEQLEFSNLDDNSRIQLQKEFDRLKNLFIKEFKLNNKNQIKKYNKIINK